jgi:glucosylceramidase
MIIPLLASALVAASASAADAPKTAAVVITAKDSPLRLSPAGTLTFVDAAQPLESQPFVLIDPTKTFQTMVGIGGALTDASADAWATLPADKRAEVVRAFFDPKEGLGYTVVRTNIHSCDFSSATYTYVAEDDTELKTFSVAHDLQNRIPLIKAAMAAAGGSLTLFASPWSPPAWMKDNGDMLHGGHLKPEYRQAWADYFVKFIRAYEKEGVPVWGMTVQNEPMAAQRWESCIFTAAEERDFLKDFLGPTLAKAGLGDKKIMVWDHNRDLLYQRASAILSDPVAAKFVWGVAYHWYETWAGGEPLYDNVRREQEAFPGKPLFFTEGTIEKFGTDRLGEWALGERYAREMIQDFNNGVVAWTDWNVMLDENGGPNHVGNYCMAALHIDTKTHELHYTDIYEYMGHFSKFVRPGARRVAVAPSRDALKATGFLNTDGTLAVVVMNQTDKPVDYSLWIHGKAAPTSAPPHSIATFSIR